MYNKITPVLRKVAKKVHSTSYTALSTVREHNIEFSLLYC